MIGTALTKIFGSKNDRELKRMAKLKDAVNALEKETEQLSDAELKSRKLIFGERLSQGETLDDLLPEGLIVIDETAYESVRGLVEREPLQNDLTS